ncbi:MAG TPA: hypothetical protein VLC51_08780 [Nitrospira sp.]|nr:hypothetical protein [Nitrospira sp.]
MIRTVRPWQIFSKLGFNNQVRLVIPTLPGRETESVMSLETELLIAAARIVGARSILELGTSMGYTSLHLAMNTDAAITTVDRERKPCAFDQTTWESRIVRIDSDIFDLDFTEPTDMVFCDVNYTPDTVMRATVVAFACDPRVVAWHDYSHPEVLAPKPILDALSESRDLIHVEDSSLVFWFKEPIL